MKLFELYADIMFLFFIQGNIALLKPTDQRDTWIDFFSSNAVDGGYQTHGPKCAQTNVPPNTPSDPWWRVDLGRVEHVAEVHILNRDLYAQRLDGAEIKVGEF